jgi:V/A-type H+-transporting ATPase subunit E
MKTLEKGREKIKSICEALREETLEPAKKEAQRIIDEAHKLAESILAEAQRKAEQLQESARGVIAQEQNAFDSSLQQAAKQSVEALRQSIEAKFFNENLRDIIDQTSTDPKLVAKLIDAIVVALNKEGVKADLTALVPNTVSASEVASFLIKDTLNSLGDGGLLAGEFAGGAKVKLNNKRLTIDLSDEALKELLSGYIVRRDFRKLVFGN